MKTFIRGILTTILVFTFTLIPTVIYAEKTINNDLIGQYFKKEITNQMTKVITEDLEGLSEEEYNKIKDTIENDEEINAFVEKYSNRIIKDLSKDKIDDINLEEDIKKILYENKDIIEKAIGRKITDEQLDKAIEEVFESEKVENSYQQIIEEARQEMPKDAQTMIDGYNTITSDEFIIISVIVSVISIIIIAILKKPYYKWIVNIGIAGIIAALFVALIGGSISLIINLVIESIEGNMQIEPTPMLITSGIMLAISIILIVINHILDNRMKKNNAIS